MVSTKLPLTIYSKFAFKKLPARLLFILSACLDTHLFVKVSRSGDSEITFSVFESSCHLLLPV